MTTFYVKFQVGLSYGTTCREFTKIIVNTPTYTSWWIYEIWILGTSKHENQVKIRSRIFSWLLYFTYSSYDKVKSFTFYLLTYRLQRIENQNGARGRVIFLFYLMKDILNYKLVKIWQVNKNTIFKVLHTNKSHFHG